MPSTNPRMVLTLKPDTYAAILRAARAANVFGSGLVSSMLDDMVPMLNSLADATQAAKEKRVQWNFLPKKKP